MNTDNQVQHTPTPWEWTTIIQLTTRIMLALDASEKQNLRRMAFCAPGILPIKFLA